MQYALKRFFPHLSVALVLLAVFGALTYLISALLAKWSGAENDIRSSGKKRNLGSGIEPFVKMVKILRKNYLQTLEIFAKLFYNSIGGLYINI